MFSEISIDKTLRAALNRLYKIDPDFKRIEKLAGTLPLRGFEPTFEALIKIVAGQQLSTKAANAIFARIKAGIKITPKAFISAPEDTLRGMGLSRSKVVCCKAISQSVLDGTLQIDALPELTDANITEQLTSIKGIGPWSAEIFMLFGLRRSDIFPAGDLALQIAYQKLKGLDNRPDRNALMTMVEPLRPYRSLVAHLLWHFYHYVNLPENKTKNSF